jgi:hypothetical protein
MKRSILAFLMIPLAACSGLPGTSRTPEPVLVIDAVVAGGPVDAITNTPDAAPDLRAAQGEPRFLGFSVTSLGDSSLPGLWLETPLVRSEQMGRIIAENGRQIDVWLRPTGGTRGSGSRLSLEGFTALGLPLTAQSTMTVVGL